MTADEINKIRKMRLSSLSYRQIAEKAGLSENTIKSFCRRNNLQNICYKENKSDPHLICKNCGNELQPAPGHRQKKFCSDKCRFAWWRSEKADIESSSPYFFICKSCDKEFTSYGHKWRKYCSHSCYIKSRFAEENKKFQA